MQTPAHELELMGANGRKLIENKYDIKEVAKQIKALYQIVLKIPGNPNKII
jgi:hypothetical protein